MAEFAIRRAEFMMVLAYASDRATGHSHDFALRSCALAQETDQSRLLAQGEAFPGHRSA